MTFLPVVAREMLIGARRKSTYRGRVLTAFLALVAMGYLLLVGSVSLAITDQGKSLFNTLSVMSFVFALVAGIAATADCLSEEKREGTLGLLFLTDLRGYDVVTGKMAASSLSAVFTLLGLVPMLALAMLLGGVTLVQIGCGAAVLLNTLFLSLSIGVFVSSLSKNERRAMFATACLILLISVTPFGIAMAAGINPMSVPARGDLLEILTFSSSPIYALLLVLDSPSALPLPMQAIGWAVLYQHLLGWVFLLMTSGILPRVAHDRPATGKTQKLKAISDRWSYGHGAFRQRYRAKLLDRNPFTWLASRERMKPPYVWGIVVFFAAFWGWIYYQFNDMAFDVMVTATILLLVQMIFKILTASEVCSRMIEDRRSGALELLLSTPLSVKQIAAGQTLALRRLFLKPVLLLLAIETSFYLGWFPIARGVASAPARAAFLAGMITLLLDLWAIKWYCMWRSLFAKSMETVLLRGICLILALPWLLFAASVLFLNFCLQAFGLPMQLFDEGSAVYIWLFYGVVISLYFGLLPRANFLRLFREIATRQLDARPQIPNSFEIWWRAFWSRVRSSRPPASRPARYWKRHPWLTSTAVVFALVILSCWTRQFYWSHQVAKRIELLKRQGAPTTERDVVMLYPLIPEEENAATLLDQALPIKPAGRPQENAIEKAREEVKLNARQLNLLHQLPRYKKCRFEIASMGKSFWQPQKIYSIDMHLQLLVKEAAVAIKDGEKAQLELTLQSMIAIFRFMRQQPTGSARYIEESALRKSELIFEQAYRENFFSKADWRKWADVIGPLSNPHTLFASLRTQRALQLDFVQNMELDLILSARGLGGSGPERAFFAAAYGFSIQTGSRDKDLALWLDRLDQYVAAANQPFEKRWAAKKSVGAVAFGPRESSLWSTRALGDLSWFFDSDLRTVTKLRCLRLALLVLGSEADWTTEKNSFLDPFCSQLLRYKNLEDGFIVYSIGQNEKDDGGELSSKNPPLDIGVRFDKRADHVLY